MSDKKNVPKIRFPGFTEPWEQRKLGEVCQEFKSGTSLKADQIDTAGDYPVYGGNGLRGYTSDYNHDGEFALIGRQGALCGNMNYSVGKAYFTEHAVVVDADINNDIKFLYYMLDTMNLGQYSDQSAQPGLAVNKLVKLENLFPTKEEQRRIGRYFSNIDHLITLHQRKLEHVKKMKKSMLQKMFPKKNQLYPEVRFPGFTDAWEQRKFGEITELKSASRVHKDEWTSNGVPFYRSSDVMAAINGTENEKAFISEELYEKLSKVSGKLEEGDILVTGGGSVGNPYIVTNNKPLYTKDADLLWIKNKGKFHPYFLYEFFFSPTFRNYLGSISHVGTIAHYTITQLSDTPICLPSFDEQKEVGEYFQSLDNLITLHQRELDHLQLLKKGMLQQMLYKKKERITK
ncbi:restriction endonuclease subunit S [Clostridium sp. AM49-4BH]|uniref:restriction endonuclease subunit S n=1 Tax=Clostridium sp. AM49-4BH TaxID=2293035 RepID=UPI001FAAFF78|nr:restriction endonuclease subunit S [Clostridium sp. AM49-4BH]